MRKSVVVGFVCILILASVPFAIGREDTCVVIDKKDRLDRIFDEVNYKMENVNLQNECNLIFKDAIIELEKYGFLGNTELEDVIKLVCCNDDSSYSISGKSSRTGFIGALSIRFYELSNGVFKDVYFLEGLSYMLFRLFHIIKNIGVISIHTGSWITFGRFTQDWEGGNEEWWPAEGRIKIVDSSGNKTEFSKFYGQIELIFEYGIDVNRIWSDIIGVKGFKGIFIGDYYMGSAPVVNIGPNHPDLDW